MSEIELKPCPFCGGEAQVNTWTMHGITESRCFCLNSDCPNSVRTLALEQWNTRPIEDELRERAEKLEAAIRAVLREPYGCRFCDSGKLRNPDASHDEDCPYVLMRMAVWDD